MEVVEPSIFVDMKGKTRHQNIHITSTGKTARKVNLKGSTYFNIHIRKIVDISMRYLLLL